MFKPVLGLLATYLDHDTKHTANDQKLLWGSPDAEQQTERICQSNICQLENLAISQSTEDKGQGFTYIYYNSPTRYPYN